MPEETAPTKARRRRLLSALILTLALAALTITLLPQAIDYGLKQWVSAQGGEKIAIGNVDFNPFTAELRIENLVITKAASEQLTLPLLELQLEWLPLWKRQIVVTGLQLSDTMLNLQHNSQGKQLTIGGMSFDITPNKAPASPNPWQLQLDQITLKNSHLNYTGPALTSSIALEQLTLTGLNTADTEKALTLSLKGKIDDADVSLEGEASPLSNSPTFNGKFSIKTLSLKHYAKLLEPYLKKSKGTLTASGTLSLQQPFHKGVKTRFNGSIGLSDYLISTTSPDRQLTGDRMNWRGKLLITAKKYNLDGKLSTSAIAFEEATTQSYKHREADWTGKLSIEPKTEQTAISGNGRLSLAQPQLKHPSIQLETERTELNLQQGTLTLTRDELQATLTTSLTLQHTALGLPENQLSSQLLQWDGTTQLKQTPDGTQVKTDGTLDGEALQLTTPALNTTAGYRTLKWRGVADIEQTATLTRLKPTGDLTVEALSAVDNNTGLSLFSLGSIELQQLHYNEDGTTAAKLIQASKLSLGGSLNNGAPTPQIELATLKLQQPRLSPGSGLTIQAIEADDLQQELIRAADKRWNIDSLIQAIERLSPPKTEQTDNPSEPLAIQIGQITLQGDSQIRFQDKTTTPPFETRLKPSTFTLTDIDSHNPERASQLTLKGVMGERSTIDINGAVKPFADKTTFDITGRIEGLELPRLSAYTAPLMGYRLQSGKANSDIKLSANKGKLEGGSELTINQLEVEPLNTEQMAALQTQLSIPLETALGMLKDKNNQIKLSLPISGDMDNITVDPSDAINQAIGRAMKKGAKTYIATALFPFGTLLTLVELAGDAAAKVQLDPIPYEPGSHLIKSEQYPYLEKVAKLLNDRPEIHIRLCGVSVEADRLALQQQKEEQRSKAGETKKNREKTAKTQPTPPLPPISIGDEQLNSLATERAQAIEKHLAEKHQIKADRLISCLPRIEAGKQKAIPRADLLI